MFLVAVVVVVVVADDVVVAAVVVVVVFVAAAVVVVDVVVASAAVPALPPDMTAFAGVAAVACTLHCCSQLPSRGAAQFVEETVVGNDHDALACSE